MKLRFSRRQMMQGVGAAALAQSVGTGEAAPGPRKWPIEEGPDTPKICLAPGDGGGPLPAIATQPRLRRRLPALPRVRRDVEAAVVAVEAMEVSWPRAPTRHWLLRPKHLPRVDGVAGAPSAATWLPAINASGSSA